MAEFELHTELLTNMEIRQCVSHRGSTAVYLIQSTKTEQYYVLKHISVPENQKQVDALIFSGAAADKEDAQHYYEKVVSDYQQELEQMQTLSSSPNLRCFRSYEIKPKEEGVGFDLYLLTEDRRTLDTVLKEGGFTHAGAVNLALDLCSALVELRGAGLIHRDVKPSNICLGSHGHYMLGDLGLAKIDELKYSSIPETMLSSFSAPELFDLMADINPTVDLYAVGLILYRIYNGNHAPLEDEKTTAKAADKLRVTGAELPPPMYADYEMASILQKACAFKPEDRYQSPEELKQELVDYMLRNQLGDDPIIPPIVADDEPVDQEAAEEVIEPVQFADTAEMDSEFIQALSPDNDMLTALIESVHRDIDNDYSAAEEETEQDPFKGPVRKKRSIFRWLPTVLVILAVLAMIGAGIWYFFIRRETIHIDSMMTMEQTIDSITVSVSTESQREFEVVCTDAYGTVLRLPYDGREVTFTGLASGAQYTVTVEGLDNEIISGAASLSASTKTTIDIVSFTATSVTVSKAELSFVVNGEEPEQWILSYGPEGGLAKTKVFSGHNVTVTGLDPNTEYVMQLMDPNDMHLTGQTTLRCSTLLSVEITDIKAVIEDSVATLTMTHTGSSLTQWDVTTTGTDGYQNTQTLAGDTIVLKGLKAGETYTIIIDSDNMVKPVQTSITPNALNIKTMSAELNEDGDVVVSWTCEAASDEITWLVSSTLVGSDLPGTVTQTNETSVVLTGLIPGCEYTIEIQESTGKELGGTNSARITTTDAELFDQYGFTDGYISTWECPEKENWTVSHLSKSAKKFKPTDAIAFVLESMSKLKDSDDTVNVLIIVRNEDGTIVDYYMGEEVWNNMWTKDKFVGQLLRTPQEPGEYTLEFYFNGCRVKSTTSSTFTIE